MLDGSCTSTKKGKGSMRLFSDSVGRKAVMAITGLLMVLFVVGHLLGNLTIFAGQNGINAYAAKLHELAPLVWANADRHGGLRSSCTSYLAIRDHARELQGEAGQVRRRAGLSRRPSPART